LKRSPYDDHLADGRVMEILGEHTCEGWLRAICSQDVMASSLKGVLSTLLTRCLINTLSGELPLYSLAPTDHSLNYLLYTSHVWQQDHSGFSHPRPQLY